MTSKFAMIDNGEVYNLEIFENLETAMKHAHILKGQDALAVNIDYIDVNIGMKYHDDWFYSVDESGNETPANKIPTEAERLNKLESQNTQLLMTLAALIGGTKNE